MEEKKLSVFIGSRISKLRKSRNITQSDLGKMIGVKNNTISAYERGVISTDQDILFKLADVLGVSINDFFPYEDELNSLKSSPYHYLPTAISAGLPINVDGITETQKISIPDSLMGKWANQKDIFITKIFGESMNRTMPDQSLIAVKPIPLENLNDGDIVVYSVNHDYSVKQLIKQADRLVFRPHSTEKCFIDDIVEIDNNDLIVHGKVVLYIVEMD